MLRRHRQHADIERVAFQLRFQRHLLHSGFPTAEIVQRRAGGDVALGDDGVAWALFTYVEGHSYDFENAGQVVEAARRLAQFHLVAETFPDREVEAGYYLSLREWWQRCEENRHAIEDLHAAKGVDEELGYLRAWWDWVLSEWPLSRVDELPVGWVYFDYHGRNMVFRGEELCGLFDFDDIGRGPLVYDIAFGARMFGRERRGSNRIRLDIGRLFIEEYDRHRALTSGEWAALPMMLALCSPPQACYHQYCRQRFGEDLTARLRREVGTMRAMRAEMARIGPWLSLPTGVVNIREADPTA